ncbi:MAG TPA: hypothetical protein DIC56_18935 [Rhizobium sp.]|nr:hypothetical protein [Rhizobium sp.]
MTNRLRIILLLCALIPLAACQRDAEHLSVNGKVFIFNIRLARAYYVLTLNRLDGVPDGAVVTAEFENPAGGPPLVSTQKVFPKMTRIDLQSPSLECVVAGKPYAIKVTLRAPDGTAMQVLETTLSSTLDQTVMPEKPLVRGAAYDRNPEAYGADGKIRMRQACAL